MPEQSTEGHEKIGRANIAYHDLVADLYDGSEGEAFQYTEFFQTRLENIVSSLAEKSGGGAFLDIGCGTGKVLKHAEKVFEKAIGIDVSFNMLKIANKRGYQVLEADALSLPFKDETFDVVSIYSVLHHIYDYTSIFHEISRVMKRKGLLYTDWDPNRVQDSNPNGWPLIRRLRKVRTALTRQLLDAGHKSMINEAVYTEVELQKKIDKELMEEAEYHNIGEGRIRGIDFKLIKQTLLAEGFVNITPKYHWHGHTLDQIISGSRITSTRVLLRTIKILGIEIERHMENIQITATKR